MSRAGGRSPAAGSDSLSAMKVFEELRAVANPVKATEMRAYMRDQFDFLGVPTPVRRAVSREFLRNTDKGHVDWGFIDACWAQPEREFQYLAVDYLSACRRALTSADIPALRRLITTKSWWDTVDGLDAVVGDVVARDPGVQATMLAWSKDDNFWLRRAAIDHQLQRKTQTDVALLRQIIENNLGQTEFFVTKAIGWALRDYAKTDPDWVRAFVDANRDRLAPLSIREATKHLR